MSPKNKGKMYPKRATRLADGHQGWSKEQVELQSKKLLIGADERDKMIERKMRKEKKLQEQARAKLARRKQREADEERLAGLGSAGGEAAPGSPAAGGVNGLGRPPPRRRRPGRGEERAQADADGAAAADDRRGRRPVLSVAARCNIRMTIVRRNRTFHHRSKCRRC